MWAQRLAQKPQLRCGERYALTVFIFLLLSLTQWLFRWALWNRFVRDKAWQFVDLLAVSNVSMIVLEERASGYYLHGKSVHSHADTGMLELHRNLKRETDAHVCNTVDGAGSVSASSSLISRATKSSRSALPGAASSSGLTIMPTPAVSNAANVGMSTAGVSSGPHPSTRPRTRANEAFTLFFDESVTSTSWSPSEPIFASSANHV